MLWCDAWWYVPCGFRLWTWPVRWWFVGSDWLRVAFWVGGWWCLENRRWSRSRSCIVTLLFGMWCGWCLEFGWSALLGVLLFDSRCFVCELRIDQSCPFGEGLLDSQMFWQWRCGVGRAGLTGRVVPVCGWYRDFLAVKSTASAWFLWRWCCAVSVVTMGAHHVFVFACILLTAVFANPEHRIIPWAVVARVHFVCLRC